MKRNILAVLLGLIILVVAIPAFAATVTDKNDGLLNQRMERLEQRMEWQKENLDKLIQDGTITEDQGKIWKEHYANMYQFHQQNGFLCPNERQGCGGGWKNRGKGYGMGQGFRQ